MLSKTFLDSILFSATDNMKGSVAVLSLITIIIKHNIPDTSTKASQSLLLLQTQTHTHTQIITHILTEVVFTSSSSSRSYLRSSYTGNLITCLFRGKHFAKGDLDTDGNLRSIKCWCSPSNQLQEITVTAQTDKKKAGDDCDLWPDDSFDQSESDL